MDHYINYYTQVLRRNLILKQNYIRVKDIPNIRAVHLHIYFKEAAVNKKNILPALLALEWVSNQRASLIRAKRSVASFKLRKGAYIGAKVTLRGKSAFAFLAHLISIILPQLKDFSGYKYNSVGFSNGFDRKGNFTIGIDNILVFPILQYNYEKFKRLRGMDITIETTAQTNKEALVLLSGLQIPFVEDIKR